MARGAPWTEHDDDVLRERFGVASPADLRRLLPGRSQSAIYERVRKLRQAGRMDRAPIRRRGAEPSLEPRADKRGQRRRDTQRQASPAAVRVPEKRGPAHLPGEPVITEHTRIVRIAAPVDERYAAERRLRVIDAQQCRPWAKEVGR
jgi:hypothetical protein